MTGIVSEQVGVITEALVREHLSRKKLVATLNAYANEQPRHPQSISKRSILQQVLGLEQSVQSVTTKAQGQLSTTVLETLVAHHLQQRTPGACSELSDGIIQPELKPSAESATQATGSSSQSVHSSANNKQPQSAAPQIVSERRVHSEIYHVGHNSVYNSKTGCAQLGVSSAQHADFRIQSALPSRLSATQQQHASTTNAMVTQPSVSQQQQQYLPEPQQASPKPRRLAAFSPMSTATSVGVSEGNQEQHLDTSKVASELPADTAVEPPAAVRPVTSQAAGTSYKPVQSEIVLEDIEDEDMPTDTISTISSSLVDVHLHQTAPAGPTRLFDAGIGTSNSNAIMAKLTEGRPIPPEQQRQLSELLWGDAGARPDAAWSQGIIFGSTTGLEWGLVQLAGGPCGVLAAVQGHLVATLMERSLWGEVVSAEVLLDVLVSSLALIIWTARSSPNAILVKLPHQTAGAAARGLCDAAQITRSAQLLTIASQQQLEAQLTVALPQYCARKGWGLLMLLYSLLLTRGCANVRHDMDDPTTCLVDHHGYCSMELVNLLLTGAAVSNVFDGHRKLDAADSGISDAAEAGLDSDSHLLKGVACQARVGLLTLFEWYKYVEVGQHLKCPRLPVWVVCSESHFTMLALDAVHMKQSRARAGKANLSQVVVDASSRIEPKAGAEVVLDYYDGMSAAECLITLTLLPAETGGWSSKLKGVADDRGTWQAKPIPPLECVIETKWQDVDVAWQGSEPIL